MPYDEKLEARIQKIVTPWENTSAKKMFGGVCHLLNGKMFCGVHKGFLILRLGKDNSDIEKELPFTRPFDITGKPMKGWIMVEPEGFSTDEKLRKWLKQAKSFVLTLPSK
ncbi:MAG: TfoX/Sxy family protein [Candidatus Tectomicrobia bacterium]|uniref:TfoX/Sxy family protein n=1 Tax=Tectimicrobiota bacterium TaxID=2528274 RepID=A0A933GLF6_UNCTE|nr:TfoX/Sxy family protein [Candidatus Tectomicrobia bacterium]